MSDRITELQQIVKRQVEQLDALRKPLSLEEHNEIAKAFHRADSVYQMLGDQAPQPYPGEKPIAYRHRLVHGLRKHSERWKSDTIHDSLDGKVFETIERSIYADAEAAAKRPTSVPVGQLREVVTHHHGKTTVRFYGDQSVTWGPFEPPMRRFVRRINRQPGV